MQVFVTINKDVMKKKCGCECKELIDKKMFDKGFIWNPSIVTVNMINRVMLENI